MNCHHCLKEMTKEEVENYKPDMCCNGRDCTCKGLPLDPPCCAKCLKEEEIKVCYICTKEINENKEYITLFKDPKTGKQLYRHMKCKPTGKIDPIKKRRGYKYLEGK